MHELNTGKYLLSISALGSKLSTTFRQFNPLVIHLPGIMRVLSSEGDSKIMINTSLQRIEFQSCQFKTNLTKPWSPGSSDFVFVDFVDDLAKQ